MKIIQKKKKETEPQNGEKVQKSIVLPSFKKKLILNKTYHIKNVKNR